MILSTLAIHQQTALEKRNGCFWNGSKGQDLNHTEMLSGYLKLTAHVRTSGDSLKKTYIMLFQLKGAIRNLASEAKRLLFFNIIFR